MKTTTQENLVDKAMARRSFLKYAGVGVIAGGVLATAASCSKDPDTTSEFKQIDLGTGDVAILNYAYALEQLEAAFYTQVIATPYSNMAATEKAMLTDIRDHEIIHRDFFKTALAGNAIPGLTPDFSKINFADRASVLGAAKAFEDLGVAAYNGVGYRIQTLDYLVLAGKIVSVEARHAAYIRSLLQQPFVDASIVTVGSTSVEISKTPAQVLPVANSFLKLTNLVAPALGA